MNFFWSYQQTGDGPWFKFTVSISAANTSITLPLFSTGAYDFVIDWGDGSANGIVTTYNDADASHTYTATGNYQIKMIGICSDFRVLGGGIKNYITTVDAWGTMGFTALNFDGCSNLVSLPAGPITGAPRMNTYVYFLRNCTSLSSIPANIFDLSSEFLTTNSAFAYAFENTGITTVPAGLFDYAVNCSTSAFLRTFGDCANLETLPNYLFRKNTSALSWQACFVNCPKLQQNEWLFYASGEESTRFLNQSPIFRSCFSRTTFTGTQGKAPELWNCSFGTGTPDTAYCWYGAGNSTTSLTNYASIPGTWK